MVHNAFGLVHKSLHTTCPKITHGVLVLAPGGSRGQSKDWTVTLENGPSPSALRGVVATVRGGGLPPLLSSKELYTRAFIRTSQNLCFRSSIYKQFNAPKEQHEEVRHRLPKDPSQYLPIAQSTLHTLSPRMVSTSAEGPVKRLATAFACASHNYCVVCGCGRACVCLSVCV